jgi:hypothetical protein
MRDTEKIYPCSTQNILRDETIRELLPLNFQEFITITLYRRSKIKKKKKKNPKVTVPVMKAVVI